VDNIPVMHPLERWRRWRDIVHQRQDAMRRERAEARRQRQQSEPEAEAEPEDEG
jgi:hypothetical protein